jgi:hypothetical protein
LPLLVDEVPKVFFLSVDFPNISELELFPDELFELPELLPEPDELFEPLLDEPPPELLPEPLVLPPELLDLPPDERPDELPLDELLLFFGVVGVLKVG